MSLKALAQERLAQLRAGETTDETNVKHAKQVRSLFHVASPTSEPMKQGIPQKTAENNGCFTVSRARERNSETSLPEELGQGLVRLRSMPMPRISTPSVWPDIVEDATRLARDGWARIALGLGWTAIDLFGAVPGKAGDPAGDGLAVKVGGRRVLAICDKFAIVSDGPGARTYIYRGNNEGARLLWELGRS